MMDSGGSGSIEMRANGERAWRATQEATTVA
jgi:hypothetical protein